MSRLALASICLILASTVAEAREPGLMVDPFVGTLADFGQLSAAAVAPYGMVQLGPDTSPANHAGYDFAATKLAGFSHTRGVGVGCSGAGGDVRVSLDYADAPSLAEIDKAHETAHAGYYSVVYGTGIRADMTATRGAGAIRFSLPKTGRIRLTLAYDLGYSKRHGAQWQATGDEIRASFSAGTVCDPGRYHLHSATRITRGGRSVSGIWQGQGSGRASLTIDARAGDVIEVRTGLSSVDQRGAGNVLATELGNRAFTALSAATLADWNRELSRLSIDGPETQQALFYTSLFRVMQAPVAIADPDGRFRGSDGVVRTLPKGEQHYTSWALWDNYRTQMPLIALIDTQRATQIARSLVRLYQSGKQRWSTQTEPFLTVRTEHAGIALLDFRRKGITGFDARAALRGMVAESATLARKTPDEQIEAAYDDWATAELAADLGETEIARRFREKALSYRPMWQAVFRDLGEDADVVHARGLYQGTLAQYRWAPVFDLPWLAQTLGPRFRPELQHFFAANLFNMTNQPDIHVPWLAAWAGDKAATLAIVRRYIGEPVGHRYTNAGVRPQPWVGPSFALSPQGFADGMDDDAGTMSAWYIWATMGLYPLVPGEARYVLTAPLAARVRLTGAAGHSTIIQQEGTDALSFNGKFAGGAMVDHETIAP